MLLAVIFRLLPRYGVSNLRAIVVNYFTCFTVGSLIHGSSTVTPGIVNESWFPYALGLSLTFIIFFNVNAYTTQKVGIVITSVFQKLSLVGPSLLGIFMFSEVGSLPKYMAIGLALLSIFLMSYTTDTDPEHRDNLKAYWYWPFIVFIGSAFIECLLFYADETGKVADAGLVFTSDLFFMAGCWGLLFILVRRQFQFTRNDFIAGVFIGIPNFFTIYLIMVGLARGWDASVLFPLNNVGVIIGATIVGLIAFREKLNKVNMIGLTAALVSVYLISS